MTNKATPCPEDCEKMTLPAEIAKQLIADYGHDLAMLEGAIAAAIGIDRSRRDPGLTAEVERLREALLKACEALENCYDVTAWPANGASLQDEALHAARAALGEA